MSVNVSARLWLASFISVIVAAGCGDGRSPTAPTPIPLAQSAAFLPGMTTALQSEYKSEFTYARVIGDFGPVLPFTTIVQAEHAHVSSVSALFASRGLAVPPSDWSTANVQTFLTVREACEAAAASERALVAFYDTQLSLTLPTDVGMVYANLRSASLNNHVPAFEACAR